MLRCQLKNTELNQVITVFRKYSDLLRLERRSHQVPGRATHVAACTHHCAHAPIVACLDNSRNLLNIVIL